MVTDAQRERLVSLYPWVKVRDFDRALRSADCFTEAVARLRSVPVRKVSEVGRRKRQNKKGN